MSRKNFFKKNKKNACNNLKVWYTVFCYERKG
jgi:hypothetical protein